MLVDGATYSTRTATPRQSPADPSIEVGSVGHATGSDIDRAFAASARAFEDWRHLAYAQRASFLRRLAELLDRDRFALAASLSVEIGKNRFEAMTEIEEAIALIDYYIADATRPDRFIAELLPLKTDRSLSVLRPYGIWAVFSPANFPLALLVGMSAAALITGNTVIAKPPPDGAITALRLVDLVKEAAFPPGVMNLVSGGVEVGERIVAHNALSGVAFTGSSRTGRQIVLVGAGRGIPVIAEMGGKNATIVARTADIELATTGIVRSAFRYSGQKCSACSRVYADGDIVDELFEGLVEGANSLRIGVPWLRETEVGSLINQNALKRYAAAVRAAGDVAEVAIVDLPADLPADGAYAAPALAFNVPESHWIATDELFLPLLCVQPVDSFDEALRRTNASSYGLTAGIYSGDDNEVGRFFDVIEAGVAYANRPAGATTGAWPTYQSFGGWKASGAAGKNAHGPYYLNLFLREQCQTRTA